MEPIQQLKKWKEQVAEADADAAADMDVAKRLLDHGIEALDKLDKLKAENSKLARVLKAAVELVCAPAWAGVSDEDCELERVLRECGYVEAPAEPVPTRAEQLAEERRAEFHAEMRADAFGDRF